MNIGMILSQSEPYQTLQVQRLDGGFVILSPPDAHWVAEDPWECVRTVAEWLGTATPKSQPKWVLKRDSVTCPPNSQFLVLKTKRKSAGKIGYVLTLHAASQSTSKQKVVFNGMTVLDNMMEWMRLRGEGDTPASIRLQVDMDPDADDVFIVKAQTSIAALGPLQGSMPGAPPWVIVCEEPEIRVGVTDAQVCAHFEVLLHNEIEGFFAARYGDGNILEVGPRIDEDDIELG